MRSKWLALSVGVAYVVAAMWLDVTPASAWSYALVALVAESLIWFPEQLGAATGMQTAHGLKSIDQETPGCVVAAFGWIVLICVPLVYWGMQPTSR